LYIAGYFNKLLNQRDYRKKNIDVFTGTGRLPGVMQKKQFSFLVTLLESQE